MKKVAFQPQTDVSRRLQAGMKTDVPSSGPRQIGRPLRSDPTLVFHSCHSHSSGVHRKGLPWVCTLRRPTCGRPAWWHPQAWKKSKPSVSELRQTSRRPSLQACTCPVAGDNGRRPKAGLGVRRLWARRPACAVAPCCPAPLRFGVRRHRHCWHTAEAGVIISSTLRTGLRMVPGGSTWISRTCDVHFIPPQPHRRCLGLVEGLHRLLDHRRHQEVAFLQKGVTSLASSRAIASRRSPEFVSWRRTTMNRLLSA